MGGSSFLYEACKGGLLCMRLSLFGLEITYAFCMRRGILFDEDTGIRDVACLHSVYPKWKIIVREVFSCKVGEICC